MLLLLLLLLLLVVLLERSGSWRARKDGVL